MNGENLGPEWWTEVLENKDEADAKYENYQITQKWAKPQGSF